jgi:serine protease Do
MMVKRNEIASSLRSLAMTWGCLIAFSFSGYSQIKNGFTIDGNVKGLKTGSKLCMVIKRNDIIDTVAKAVAINGIFRFRNVKLPVYPEFYLICVQTEFVENLQLFLDQAGDVKITGALEKWPDVTVTGSKMHCDYLTAKKIIQNVWDKDFAVKHPGRSAPPDTILLYSKKGIEAVVNRIPESDYIPPMLANWTYTSKKWKVDGDLKRPFYERLSTAQKNSYQGRILSKQIADDMENKRLMDALKKSSDGMVSFSREVAAKELLENAGNKVSISSLPSGVSALTKDELIKKTKATTLIVNMAYKAMDTGEMTSNPTTAYMIDESGICVTNYHVLKEYSGKQMYQSLSVMTTEGKVYPVTAVLSSSESDDLVIFKVGAKGDKLKALPLGNAAAEKTAIHVMAHPYGSFYQFTSGIVSENTASTLAGKPVNIMGITADFGIGSSGGPIVDNYGNVVGTVSRISGGMKVGIPVSELNKLIEFKK